MFSPDLTFRPRMSVLSPAQIEQIHQATLELLERTGVQVTHGRARELLQGAGAHVDGNRVRIPAWMVEDAIRTAPSRVVLGNRSGERRVFLEGDKSWFGPSVDCIDYLDPATDQRRRFTSDDCRVTATVADALPNFTWVMTIGMADDVPPNIADRVVARQVFTYTEKPLVFCCKDVNSIHDIYEMALLIAGGEARFRQAPTIVHYSEPISPLVYYDPAVDKILYCAEMGIPLINFPAPQGGSTAPATFAGEVVQASAESLSGLVMAQLMRPGAPFIYGAFTTIMDMRTTIFSYGAPEMSLMTAALAQMAQHYRLPFFGTAGCSDAKFPDPQAAAEVAFSCLSSALAGANLIHDAGSWLDHGSLASPGFMVLVNEILYMVNQFMGGLPVNDETLALDVMDRVGPGGHYLADDHTVKHFKDVWYSKGLFDRTIYQLWQAQGSKRFEERLAAKTAKIMQHQPTPLPDEILKELAAMAQHWN
ncbi:MAG: trimethylamine methyltransferase family protein [Chloroflexi bacterium]|nr:trimethylamine methyltransferase family protein [Chloroflexota bacterium]